MRRPTACEVPHVPVEVMEINRPGPFLVADKQLDVGARETLASRGSLAPEFVENQSLNDLLNNSNDSHNSSDSHNSQKPNHQIDHNDQNIPSVYVFPASLEQIRYWTLNQLDGASTASNMAIAVRIDGPVDDQLVEQAVQALVERHEALRTTFRLVDGQLSQIISEEAKYSFAVTDLRSLPEGNRNVAIDAAIEEHSHARADLATGPAFFARLIHETDRRHVLAFTMHHIVCDGWSNGILTRDFTDIYASLAEDREPRLPELPFQFADFTVWQQNWLETDAATDALAYWRTHIRREMPAVDLPTDAPRQARKSYPGHIESSLLPGGLAAKLKTYCRTHNATMHQVLLAAFEALIARYANQTEFLLGSTIANRTQPGMENVVGRFANPQVILADVQGDPSYRELLRRVIDWSTESYAHQDLPFSRLMEEFQLDQAGASSQFLQVYFVYQKAFMQPQQAAGIQVTPRPSVSGGVNFDLLVSIVERAEGPRLQMEYNTVLFRPERIQNLIAMYLRVLDSVMADDSISVSRLPLVAAPSASQENTRLSVPESSKESAQPDLPSLAEWLDRLAARLGTADAVVIGERTDSQNRRLSWTALELRSLAMAASLTTHGITAGQTVALRFESNEDTVIAAWALLRIGAVVLPLPATTAPAEWIQILATHQPALALASKSFAAQTSGVTAIEDLPAATSAALAYPNASKLPCVIFLSPGSAPPVTQEAVLRRLLATAAALDLRSGETVLSTAADSAVDAWVDLMMPLVAGATLVHPAMGAPGKTSAHFLSLADSHNTSFVFASASEVISAIQDHWAGDRRLNLLLRGQIVSAAQVARITAVPLRLWALTSSVATAGPVAVSRIAATEQPTFLPFAGERLLILDDNDQPVPSGVLGELAVSAPSVDSGMTTRTGYLARLSNFDSRDGAALPAAPDSNAATVSAIEILDRTDRLVRLHGYRLRLSELEEVLWQNPAVAETVAAILPVDGTDTLVAYYRALPHAPGGAEPAVRERFRSIAPGMVASAELIAVDSIPRRADGSADLALLPAPGQATRSSSDEYVPPRDELESNLVAIWEDVLGVRPIGIRTQFFKLGGYSLMIVRLFARINKLLGTSLPITTIFNAPTVEQLADIVRGRAYYSSLVPVRTTGKESPFFMIHSYLLYQGIPAVLGADTPFYGLRELDTDSENMTVEQRAATYLDAIRSVQPHGPYFLGGWCAAGPLAVETARQISASGEKVGFLVLFDSWRPGYSAELSREQAGTREMSLKARLGRKYRFHRNRWRTLSTGQKVHYVAAAIGNKLASVRNRLYLKNWAKAEWFCRKFGLTLPHFMHNVSLTTLNSLSEYRGVEPYAGSMTLIRAKEAPYFPGAQEHCGWNSIVKGGVVVLWAPGDHESMFLDPHLHTVGELLRQSITEAQRSLVS